MFFWNNLRIIPREWNKATYISLCILQTLQILIISKNLDLTFEANGTLLTPVIAEDCKQKSITWSV